MVLLQYQWQDGKEEEEEMEECERDGGCPCHIRGRRERRTIMSRNRRGRGCKSDDDRQGHIRGMRARKRRRRVWR